MNLFFDCEFTGLRQNTTLISIGIVSEDGRKFYAEFADYDRGQCDNWIEENVISHLRFSLPRPGEDYYVASRAESNPTGNNIFDAWNLEMNGTGVLINECLNHWLMQFDSIQFVSDVCHYDFVLLIDLLTNGGTALDLPENISAVCHDINTDIANYYKVSDREAFDMSREQIMYCICDAKNTVAGDKHNSLYDAEVIKAIYEVIQNDKT